MLQINHRVIAHRGASAYAPENTFSAFDKALALGSSMIEFDVMLSQDGEAFVFHDESLIRTTNGRGEFNEVSAQELQKLDAGSWFSRHFSGEKIPLFTDVLKWLTFTNMQANIEIKPYPGTAEKTTINVLTQINRYWPNKKPLPLISSFDLTVLTLCHDLAPEMPLGLLLDSWEEDWLDKAKKLDCFSMHFNKNVLTESRIKEVKTQNYDLYVYTVNRKKHAQHLLSWGVDAVFSDYPDLLL